jgi:hypothetical protein
VLGACGLPILLAFGPRTGVVGCVLAAAMSGAIVVASVVAWFLTCSALGGGLHDGGAAGASFVVGIAVFVGLTALAVWRVRSSRRKRGVRRRAATEFLGREAT